MEINNLEMISFRNHRKTNIDFDPGLTIIWGENGSGKTSILEAIHSLSYGKSFRTNNKKDLIKKGSDFFFIKGSFKNTENFKNTVSLSQDIKGNKKIQIDNKVIKKRKDLFGLNNVVVFSPEEEGITKGTSLFRRNYFDRIFSICSYDYLDSLLLYNKTIKQRNIILKNNNSLFKKEKELEIWDKPFCVNGLNLWQKRETYMNSFIDLFLKTITNFDKNLLLNIKYDLEIKTNKDFLKKIKENKHLDLAKKYTSFGPHKDDVVFLWNNQKIKNHGSQGEHKIFLALLKITEYMFLSNKTKKTPIFLIDDMFANLDKERSKKLLRFIETIENDNKEKSQTIITTTNIVNIKENGFFMEFDDIKKHHLIKNGTT